MSDSLPTEILAIIIEDVISEYARTMPNHRKIIRFIPRWYLTSILRVSKRWNAVCAKYLYNSIAVGGGAPFEFPAREREPYFQTDERRQLYVRQATRRIRMGHEVAEDLYKTLSLNSRLTTFITKLQLGIEPNDQEPGQITYSRLKPGPEWTKTHIRILQLCPNVEHVEVRGFQQYKLDALVDVLKTKSLVSLSLTTWDLSYSTQGQGKGGSVSQIFDMMQTWPKIKSIRAEKFLREIPGMDMTHRWSGPRSFRVVNFEDDDMEETPATLDTSEVSRCCPDLREIVITGDALSSSDLRRIRAMSGSGVTMFAVSLYGNRVRSSGDAATDALCECLRAWSPTLEYLKIDSGYNDPYPALNDAISTLRELRELQFGRMKIDFGSIYRLPLLERFACIPAHSIEEVRPLSSYLKNLQNFPSLKCLILRFDYVVFPNEVEVMCFKRKIEFGFFPTLDFIL